MDPESEGNGIQSELIAPIHTATLTYFFICKVSMPFRRKKCLFFLAFALLCHNVPAILKKQQSSSLQNLRKGKLTFRKMQHCSHYTKAVPREV